jgi:hypothetical protein
MPALVSIIAKVIVLIDQALESFVTVSAAGPQCGIWQVNATVETCGFGLANAIESLIMAGTNLLVYLMGGLGVVNVS